MPRADRGDGAVKRACLAVVAASALGIWADGAECSGRTAAFRVDGRAAEGKVLEAREGEWEIGRAHV